MRRFLTVSILVLLPTTTFGSGHGPLFGGATPTLGRGGWQLDQTWMGRHGELPDQTDEQMLRTMLSVGITEDLQLSVSMPIPLQTPKIFMPNGRMMSLMSTDRQFESIGTWRFRRRPTQSGGRRESALIGGVSFPYEKYLPDGMRSAPSATLAAATGYASRAHYFWASGGYQRRMANHGDKLGDIAYGSLVYGYRPPALRLEYPKPDLRFFAEAVLERTSMAQHHGLDVLYTGGTALFVGPTALLLYKAYGLQAGLLFPAYQATNGFPERFRFAVNVSYFFWMK
jgi:hypothetical protein